MIFLKPSTVIEKRIKAEIINSKNKEKILKLLLKIKKEEIANIDERIEHKLIINGFLSKGSFLEKINDQKIAIKNVMEVEYAAPSNP